MNDLLEADRDSWRRVAGILEVKVAELEAEKEQDAENRRLCELVADVIREDIRAGRRPKLSLLQDSTEGAGDD